MSFAELGEHYLQSGDALIAESMRDHATLDVHVYAICFLYRHALELRLKDLAWKSGYALGGAKKVPKHHRLIDLWNAVETATSELDGAAAPIDYEQRSRVRELLEQFEEHDPGSDAFRYPLDKRLERSHPELVHVDVRTLKDAVHDAFDGLYVFAERIAYYYGQRNEYEASARA